MHVIRDPLEVCASSYLYALRSNESWLRTPSASTPSGSSLQQYYRSAPTREGVAFECRRCFKELKQAATLYEATRGSPRALTLRLEELVELSALKRGLFDATLRRVLGFAGLAPAAWDVRGSARWRRLLAALRRHDTARWGHKEQGPQPRGMRVQSHVSNASQKGALRALLLDEKVGVATELRKLRERLDYGDEADADARLRRWRLGGLASVT